MSSKKCVFNPEKARIAAENVRAYMKLRGQDFDVMIEESDKILKGLSDAELKSVAKEFQAYAHSIKRFPKGQLKEVAAKVDLKSNANTKYRVPGRTVQLNPRRSIFVRGGAGQLEMLPNTDQQNTAQPNTAQQNTAQQNMDQQNMDQQNTEFPSGGSSQRGRSGSANSARSGSANSARSGSTLPQRGRSRSRSRSRTRHLGPQGQGLIPGVIRVAALLIPRTKTRFFQTIMWMALITMAGYSGTTDGSFVQVGLKQINSGNCEGGWGAFDWNRHPLCTAWKGLKAPIVTGMNEMYKADKQGFFTLLSGLAGLAMSPMILNSGIYWLAYFMDYAITLTISAFLNIEFVEPEAQEPGLFRMFALYKQVTNPLEAFLWGRRLMGNKSRSRSRHRHRNRNRTHRSSSGHRNRGHRNRGHRSRSSTRNLVELARIRALQNIVRQERSREAAERSPSPASLAPTRRRQTLNLNNQNSRLGNNVSVSSRGSRSSRRNSRRNAQNTRSNVSSRRGSRR